MVGTGLQPLTRDVPCIIYTCIVPYIHISLTYIYIYRYIYIYYDILINMMYTVYYCILTLCILMYNIPMLILLIHELYR